MPRLRWSLLGERANHCRGGRFGGCCRTYHGLTAFDRHHPSDDSKRGRTCMTAGALTAAGWTTDDNGWWHLPAKDEKEDDE